MAYRPDFVGSPHLCVNCGATFYVRDEKMCRISCESWFLEETLHCWRCGTKDVWAGAVAVEFLGRPYCCAACGCGFYVPHTRGISLFPQGRAAAIPDWRMLEVKPDSRQRKPDPFAGQRRAIAERLKEIRAFMQLGEN
ncbi:MAG: hypothetical protein Q8R13_06290 [bacterium]|nr:hypothetical protein [bacterium]